MTVPLLIICGVIILVAVVSYAIAAYVFSAYIKRPKKENGVEEWFARIEKSGRRDIVDAFLKKSKEIKSLPYKEITISSDEGLALYAKYYDRGSDTTAVLVHGMHGSPLDDMVFHFEYFYNKGFNILLPDQRAHGKSEGQYITYGAMERSDVTKWCSLVANERGKEHKIILCGISLGASSALLAAALSSMPPLYAVIADCGYSDMMEEFRRTIRRRTHLPPLFVEPMLWSMCCKKAGFNPLCVNIPSVMHEVKAPVLFIHGEKDGLVFNSDTDKNAAACRTYHEVIKIPDARHALAFAIGQKECTEAADAFLLKIENN